MPAVLTVSSTVMCVHGGSFTLTASTSQLTAGGSPVLVRADLTSAVIAGCPNTVAASGQVPCTAVVAITAGAATTLTVAGQPVMLASAAGVTNSTPPGTWSVSAAGQSVLSAA